MENKADEQKPDASTLWLAIGLGGFSVIASFFLAICSSSNGVGSDTASNEVSPMDAAEHAQK